MNTQTTSRVLGITHHVSRIRLQIHIQPTQSKPHASIWDGEKRSCDLPVQSPTTWKSAVARRSAVPQFFAGCSRLESRDDEPLLHAFPKTFESENPVLWVPAVQYGYLPQATRQPAPSVHRSPK